MKTKIIRVLSIALAICVSVGMISATVWATSTERTVETETKYKKLDTNQLMNLGQDPEEISVQTQITYFEKQWYEFITYSEKAVASYRIDDDTRLLYYDPYDYLSSMVMDVRYEDEIGWSTANSVTITHEFSTTMSTEKGSSIEYSSSKEEAEGKDVTYSKVKNSGTTVTEYAHTEHSDGFDRGLGLEVGTGEVLKWVVDIQGSGSLTWSDTTTTFSGTDTVTDNTESETDGWTEVAARITKTTGSASSTSNGWSTTETKSISRTFEAAYFNSENAPLLWTIVHFEAKMPMKMALQRKINGEWQTVDTAYVLLTTISGSCRAWQENGNIYYEHWATGEPIVDDDFWTGYFTDDNLASAYQNKMYPD